MMLLCMTREILVLFLMDDFSSGCQNYGYIKILRYCQVGGQLLAIRQVGCTYLPFYRGGSGAAGKERVTRPHRPRPM